MDTTGGSKQISKYTDQAGNPVSREQMFRMVSESMLANVIAFEEAGVSLKELKQAVGRDGGTIIGRGVVFQTPCAAVANPGQEDRDQDGAGDACDAKSENKNKR